MGTKLISLIVALVRGFSAVCAITIMLIGPAAALDRLLSLGMIEVRPWLDKQCSEVDKVTDVAEVEARKERVLQLYKEAMGQVGEAINDVSKWEQVITQDPGIEGAKPEIKFNLDKAQKDLLVAKKVQDHVQEMLPAILRCIEYRKTELAGGPSQSLPIAPTPTQCRPSTLEKLTLIASANTPCVFSFSALENLGDLSSMRIEAQPSHGSAEWSNAVLTYRPAADYKGRDRLKISQPALDLVDGQLVSSGRRTIIEIEVIVE